MNKSYKGAKGQRDKGTKLVGWNKRGVSTGWPSTKKGGYVATLLNPPYLTIWTRGCDMNSRYASGKYRFEVRLLEEVPEGRKGIAQRFIAGNK